MPNWLGVVAGVAALFLTSLNFMKGGSDWAASVRQHRTEKQTKKNEQQLGELQIQFDSWRAIVEDQQKQLDDVRSRLSATEEKLESCEEERNAMYRRYVLKEKNGS